MKKLILLALFLFPSVTWCADEALIDPQETMKANKSVDVRVQDNEWLRIMDYFVEEKRMGEMDKDFEKIPGLKDVITKKLYVKILFLKQCKAKLLSDKMKEASSRAEMDKYIGIGIYITGYALLKTEKEREEYRAKALELSPDLDKIIEEYYLFPKFKCDYRIKVFATFYNSKGTEVKTDEQIPIAYWKDDRERKIEMLPGETTYVTFIIPDGATSWDIWLPK